MFAIETRPLGCEGPAVQTECANLKQACRWAVREMLRGQQARIVELARKRRGKRNPYLTLVVQDWSWGGNEARA